MSQENEMPKVGESVRYKWKKQEETEWRNLDKIYTGKIEFINDDGCVISNEAGCAFFDYADVVVEFIPEQTQADRLRDEQIEKITDCLLRTSLQSFDNPKDYAAPFLYDKGIRVLAPDERICKPLSDEQVDNIGSDAIDNSWSIKNIVDAVQRELKLIEG